MPQGSCLGPLLYSIFTNDLPLVLKEASIGMYADDSTICASTFTISELNTVLEDELRAVSDWVDSNKLVLNVFKTNRIVFGSQHFIRSNPEIKLKSKISVSTMCRRPSYWVSSLIINCPEKHL